MGEAADGGEGAALVWFRDDLRLADNPALSAAAATGLPLVALYVLDEGGDRRPLGGAARWWLHHSLAALKASLAAVGVPLVLRRGRPETVLGEVAAAVAAREIHWNRRYGGPERALDGALKASLGRAGHRVENHNGHLLVEPWTVRTKGGEPFKVFTPFWRAAREQLHDRVAPLPVPPLEQFQEKCGTVFRPELRKNKEMEHFRDSEKNGNAPAGLAGVDPGLALDALALLPTAPDWSGGLAATWQPGEAGAHLRLAAFLDDGLARYAAERDKPAADATSRLSPHLRFGEISVGTVWSALNSHAAARHLPETAVAKFTAELGWREFSYHLLFQVPDLAWRNFQPRFDGFPWQEDQGATVRAWQRGTTGYPIVDAGMRELWQTGSQHNRVRMITASFLVKHLMMHWRIGEAWFWDTLVDADAASNAASWQWVAGSGADAAPYFRVFNPVKQGETFDPDGRYVRRFLPELASLPDACLHSPWAAKSEILRNRGVVLGRSYPEPIVDHQTARNRALAAFAQLKSPAA